MDRIPHATGRIRQLTARLASEEEVIATSNQFASRLREKSPTFDQYRRLSGNEFEALSQSGLLAITVPPEYGGIDISNTVLAKITAIISEADARIGRIVESHFYILEALRTDGTEEQKRFFFGRALAGDRFVGVSTERDSEAATYEELKITRDGLGYRVNGRGRDVANVAFADWISIVALNDEDRLIISFIQHGTEGARTVSDHASGAAVLDNVYIHADAVVAHHKSFERPTAVGALGQILDASVDLGVARRRFADVIAVIKMRSRSPAYGRAHESSGDARSLTRVGELAVQLEAATALIESAGLKADIAQIETTQENVTAATLAAGAAKVLTSEIAIDAYETLIELAAASSVGSGLDRLCHATDTRALQYPAHRKYHAALGNYHLNGVTPSSTLGV
ncbi:MULTISPECIES: acyl-CoA dehydrogenase family protein [unclassified Rhizobium]|uniref:acyl-CoA dehydrogenase family protein n=1 Tax=unclassified Rhizobium TaxID=2613769 RepID=UPI001AD97229|nr:MULTISPECIES: acyl-CoA dehydrogenase family protein [unclassified Rhizobium]MBO9123843.1 acyl-CoA dehydrogenase family protein [Rhizobium sp. 16-488-2b]MBO9174375.1 acyl-CoA dehydrogenase family protein [Rhizobium sp. 16-488-2a]